MIILFFFALITFLDDIKEILGGDFESLDEEFDDLKQETKELKKEKTQSANKKTKKESDVDDIINNLLFDVDHLLHNNEKQQEVEEILDFFNFSSRFPKINESGKQKIEVRKLSSFTGIKINSVIQAYITIGNENSIKIEGDENVVNKVETEIRSNTLCISLPGFTLSSIVAFVTSINPLESIVASVHSLVEYKSDVKVNSFSVQAFGDSKINVEFECNDFEIQTRITSKVQLSGKANNASISTYLSSELSINSLSVNTVDIEANAESRILGNITANEVCIHSANASEIYLQLTSQRVQAQLTEGSEVSLMGNSSYLDFQGSGTSEMNAMSFIVQVVDVQLTNAASAKINAKKELNYNISGNSKLKYISDPEIKKGLFSGNSSISHYGFF